MQRFIPFIIFAARDWVYEMHSEGKFYEGAAIYISKEGHSKSLLLAVIRRYLYLHIKEKICSKSFIDKSKVSHTVGLCIYVSKKKYRIIQYLWTINFHIIPQDICINYTSGYIILQSSLNNHELHSTAFWAFNTIM